MKSFFGSAQTLSYCSGKAQISSLSLNTGVSDAMHPAVAPEVPFGKQGDLTVWFDLFFFF